MNTQLDSEKSPKGGFDQYGHWYSRENDPAIPVSVILQEGLTALHNQLDSEKYLDALMEVVYTTLERSYEVYGYSGYALRRVLSVSNILLYISLNTSPETLQFLVYNGLTTEYVMSWLRSRSEKEGG